MGRHAKPAELKRAQGNPGKRALPRAEEAAPPAESAPSIAAQHNRLKREARLVWDKLAPDLERMKFLRVTDVNAVERYCEYLASWWLLTQKLRRSGNTYVSKSQHGKLERLRANFIARDRIEARIEALEDRIGLTPRARQQIMVALAARAPQMPQSPHADGAPSADKMPGELPLGDDNPIGFLQ